MEQEGVEGFTNRLGVKKVRIWRHDLLGEKCERYSLYMLISCF
jgi:hypothetical protein